MRRHSTTIAFIGFLASTTLVQAQVPPATATTGAAAAQQAAPLAAGADVGFFGKCFQACEDCKRKLCSMPLGTMLNSMTQPFSAMSGGVIPNFCPTVPSAEDLAKSGAEGASAHAKKDAAEAKARRAAVRYLGTLDCRYYPEAEGALIAALRTDGVECVRWEAALVLGKGCCCSKKVIEALTHAVSCSEKDGNPAERSERVRFAACLALERCLACYSEPVETPEEDSKIKEK
ncbi:MAG TPA: HEAT repeat domain-containing protein, partial [Gemmatales bacterium]|nr:HEAT repeat domain-containing protein [Gemmatales bacterium]